MGKKPKDIPPPKDNETPFQRFERLAKKVVGVRKNVAKKQPKEHSSHINPP